MTTTTSPEKGIVKAKEVNIKGKKSRVRKEKFSDELVKLIKDHYKFGHLTEIKDESSISWKTISDANGTYMGTPAVVKAFTKFYKRIAKKAA